jgi:predicted membrane channel-forming protein YqfA (hemolysin III family)
MFSGLKNGWDVLKASIKAFFKHPIFLIPLLIVWLIYAPVIIYLKWHFNWQNYTTKESALIVFLIIFGFSLLLTISCSLLLELIQQKETGRKFNLFRSLSETVTKNIIQIIVLSFFWAILWFVLSILEAFLSKRDNSEEKEKENAENIARTLSNTGNVSLTSLSFDALKKGIRMIVFLIMPAFAWENFGISKSIKRGLSILKQRSFEFVSGYTLTYLAAAIVFIPPAIMFKLRKEKVEFPDWAWVLCIIYIAFAWSYTIYLEQMFTAELYLRQLKWEKQVAAASKEGKKLPKFGEIFPSSVIDDKPDLI